MALPSKFPARELMEHWQPARYAPDGTKLQAFVHADDEPTIMYLIQAARRPGGNTVFEDSLVGAPLDMHNIQNYAHTNGIEPFIFFTANGKYKDWSKDPRVLPQVKQLAEASIAARLQKYHVE